MTTWIAALSHHPKEERRACHDCNDGRHDVTFSFKPNHNSPPCVREAKKKKFGRLSTTDLLKQTVEQETKQNTLKLRDSV